MGHNLKSIDSLGCRQKFVETSGLSKRTAGRQKSYNLRVVDNGFRRTRRSDQGRAGLQNLPCRLAMSAPAGKWRLRPSTASSYRPVPAALRLQANGAAPLKRQHGCIHHLPKGWLHCCHVSNALAGANVLQPAWASAIGTTNPHMVAKEKLPNCLLETHDKVKSANSNKLKQFKHKKK